MPCFATWMFTCQLTDCFHHKFYFLLIIKLKSKKITNLWCFSYKLNNCIKANVKKMPSCWKKTNKPIVFNNMHEKLSLCTLYTFYNFYFQQNSPNILPQYTLYLKILNTYEHHNFVISYLGFAAVLGTARTHTQDLWVTFLVYGTVAHWNRTDGNASRLHHQYFHVTNTIH